MRHDARNRSPADDVAARPRQEPERRTPTATARRRSPDPSRQHLRHAGRGRIPPRLHGQRAVLRHRHVFDHRLCRRARRPRRADHPLHRRSGSALPRRSRAHASRGGPRAPGCSSPSISRCSMRSPSIDTRSREAHRRGWSRSTTRSCDPVTRKDAFKQLRDDRAAEGDHAGTRRRRPMPVWQSIAALDRYRARFEAAPESLTNAILAGTLLHPLGPRGAPAILGRCARTPGRAGTAADCPARHRTVAADPRHSSRACSTPRRAARTQRALLHRAVLTEAITWLEIHGDRPDVVAHWRGAAGRAGEQPHAASDETGAPAPPLAPSSATPAAWAPRRTNAER